jgi:hypothetical protein
MPRHLAADSLGFELYVRRHEVSQVVQRSAHAPLVTDE